MFWKLNFLHGQAWSCSSAALVREFRLRDVQSQQVTAVALSSTLSTFSPQILQFRDLKLLLFMDY
jgi:hypothetical protein